MSSQVESSVLALCNYAHSYYSSQGRPQDKPQWLSVIKDGLAIAFVKDNPSYNTNLNAVVTVALDLLQKTTDRTTKHTIKACLRTLSDRMKKRVDTEGKRNLFPRIFCSSTQRKLTAEIRRIDQTLDDNFWESGDYLKRDFIAIINPILTWEKEGLTDDECDEIEKCTDLCNSVTEREQYMRLMIGKFNQILLNRH